MKNVVWIFAAASLAIGGSKEISMLNQQILSLEASNMDLKAENKSLTDAATLLDQKVAVLDSTAKARQRIIDDQNIKIEELEKKLKGAMASLELMNKPSTGVTVAATSSTPVISMFPMTSTIMTKKGHDASSIALLLSFYNGSGESVSSFDARLHFMQNGEELLACNVNVNKPVASTENTTWYGAIPYNSSDAKNVRFFDADPSTITVTVEVLSITLPNGTVRKFK